ncbi:MAG: peptidase C11 [Ruminococcus sp.]|nr:peptidase C11 [Ruminococcus sp.]
MDQNNNQGRRKNVTSGGSGVHKRGDGLGTGPVGNKDYSGKNSSSTGGPKRAAAIGGGGGLAILAIIAMLIFGKGGGLGSLLGGGGTASTDTSSFGNVSTGGHSASSAVSVDSSVASGSREKRTVIKGGGQDKVTIMVYMCGTDLESKYGMASNDMQEMAAATYGDNVNIIVYTGGCSGWKTSGISNKVNQIYQIKDGKLLTLESDMGSKAMTNPDNLASFIQYCAANYPANRNELIFWDHGGGSVSGYGYDEKNKSAGSMSLDGINKALKSGGVTFDFIGFDACLMATAENALMLNSYADYLIASEETEPGIGWYYTNWLTKLGSDTSMSTLDIGKLIADDFVDECARKCKGQKTTLSVIDLAEFSNTVPANITSFSKSVSSKISASDYQSVSDARYRTREFAESSKIDQVDLVDLALNMGTEEGVQLSKAIQGAVKYNRTSTNMTNAYGVSIYFPYKRTSYVDPACSTYSAIGMDSEYSRCIKQFASLETSGQIAAGGTASPLGSLFGGSSSGVSGGSDIIGSLLSSFLGGGGDRSIDGLDRDNISFMDEGDVDEAAEYISLNHLDVSNLVWEQSDGEYKLTMPESQWAMIHDVALNMFYFDGEGYIDLGMDYVFKSFDGKTLVADTDRNWLAINGQNVAFYYLGKTNDTITGYVPAFLNGERVNLMLVFDNDNPNGYIAGATTDYIGGETNTVAKAYTELQTGDQLEFICDYYTTDMKYQDSYLLGDPVTVSDSMTISNVDVGSGEVRLMYCLTDMYGQDYWTEAIIK